MNKKNRYFVLNTDREKSPNGEHEDEILNDQCSWLYSSRDKYLKPQYNLNEDDVIFLYSNSNGIIAAGFVSGELIIDKVNKRAGYKLKDLIFVKSNPLRVDVIKDKLDYSMVRSINRSIFKVKDNINGLGILNLIKKYLMITEE